MTCERCGQSSAVGEHGIGACPYQPRQMAAAVKPDTILGGFVAENAWREPRYFDSQKKYERALDESGLMLKPKKTRGAFPVSPETLKWAAERVAARSKTVPIAERVLEDAVTVGADA